MLNIFKILFFIEISFHLCHCGLFSWVFKGYEKQTPAEITEDPPNRDIGEDNTALKVNIPFEMTVADEKFISEVTSLTSVELSQLDKCHHKVILSLKSTCSEMSEEELAKVAVNLLNCQSLVEGRNIYPCTNEMSIQECTQDMDLSTWNAYHIVSNRARAVCYQFRQQQFKAKTELTINKLMVSALDQINTMKELEVSQVNLKENTYQTFQNLTFGHKMLLEQQEHLSASQQSIHNYVASNLRELSKEKRLIALGQKELTQITESIKKKLTDAQKQLQEQGVNQQGSHKKILFDLASIQESAMNVGKQLDESTMEILETHEQTIAFYHRLMQDLDQMNGTVYHLMNLIKVMKAKFEERFTWISLLIGDTDETVRKISSFSLHVIYFFLSMVGAGFLKIPYPTRVFLVILVPLNAFCELRYSSSLPFSTLSIVLLSFLCINLSSKSASRLYRRYRVKVLKIISGSGVASAKNKEAPHTPTTGDHDLLSLKHPRHPKIEHHLSDKPFGSADRYSQWRQRSGPRLRDLHTEPNFKSSGEQNSKLGPLLDSGDTLPVRQRLFAKREPAAELNSFSSVDSEFKADLSTAKGSPNGKKCIAICKSGLPCRNTSISSSSHCSRHLRGLSRENTPLK